MFYTQKNLFLTYLYIHAVFVFFSYYIFNYIFHVEFILYYRIIFNIVIFNLIKKEKASNKNAKYIKSKINVPNCKDMV